MCTSYFVESVCVCVCVCGFLTLSDEGTAGQWKRAAAPLSEAPLDWVVLSEARPAAFFISSCLALAVACVGGRGGRRRCQRLGEKTTTERRTGGGVFRG